MPHSTQDDNKFKPKTSANPKVMHPAIAREVVDEIARVSANELVSMSTASMV